MLGGLFATAMTSFIQLPSSQILSLAASTFFPLLVQPFSSHVKNQISLPKASFLTRGDLGVFFEKRSSFTSF